MDFDNLSESLKFANHLGQALTLELQYYRIILFSRTQLKLKGEIFRQTQDCDEMKFWGRVAGLYSDYYIICLYRSRKGQNLPERSFFWRYSTI